MWEESWIYPSACNTRPSKTEPKIQSNCHFGKEYFLLQWISRRANNIDNVKNQLVF